MFIVLAISWSLYTISSALASPAFLQDFKKPKQHHPVHIHPGQSRFWHEHDLVTERTLPPSEEKHHASASAKIRPHIEYVGITHINIVVDDLEKASSFYETVLGFKPAWGLKHFRNAGMGRAAGFSHSEAAMVDVSIRVMNVAGPGGTHIELMQFHSPEGKFGKHKTLSELWEAGQGVGHVCLKVKDIQRAFKHLKRHERPHGDRAAMGVTFISSRADYGPFQLDPADLDSVEVFHPYHKGTKGGLHDQKVAMAELIGRVSSLYFSDPYGVRWVLDEVEA
eukprot:CAMPEP_0198216720 /NCGR_PEP_ID=MMETSP1445-20131203/59307_1 /TAXON_ID=36898 /ORGANISM="Pyramimonas sp., Strain CCMP2087" /LENGTH=279 /DNA_ID=CAMNT_0043893095 /DNA_START=342 /DNA_END=1181 /DNA_ORIENTATION=-